MSWVKLDDKFSDHPKIMSVGPLGAAMQVAALCYSNAHLTDGFIAYNVVRKLLCFEFSPPGSDVVYTIGVTSGMAGEDVAWDMVAGWLVDAGVWEQCEGGYRIHDYLDYQPSKDQVVAERSKAQERMKKSRSREVRENSDGTNEELPAKFNDPGPVPDPESLIDIGIGGLREKSADAFPPSPADPDDLEHLTVKQAEKYPEIRIFLRATGRMPGRPTYRTVIDTIRDKGFTVKDLQPYWRAWNERGYNPGNLAWLTEWAVSGEIPKNGQPRAGKNGKTSTQEEMARIMAELEAEEANGKQN